MRKKYRLWMVSLLAASAGAGVLLHAADGGLTTPRGSAASEARGLDGITKPSGDVIVAFVRPGLVTEVLVKEGDIVTAKAVIARQDDHEEQAMMAIDKADADDQTELEAEQAVCKQDTHSEENMKASGGVSQFELDDAGMKVILDQARIKVAMHKQSSAQLKLQATQAAVAKLVAISPIAGTVAETMVKPGEVADGQNMKIARIVQLDPLWVDVAVPFAQARALKQGEPAQVTFGDKQVRPGSVRLVYAVGDSAAGTIKVRVEVPNPQKLQAGEGVSVRFAPAPNVAAAHP